MSVQTEIKAERLFLLQISNIALTHSVPFTLETLKTGVCRNSITFYSTHFFLCIHVSSYTDFIAAFKLVVLNGLIGERLTGSCAGRAHPPERERTSASQRRTVMTSQARS